MIRSSILFLTCLLRSRIGFRRARISRLVNPLVGWEKVVESTVVLTPNQYPWTDGSGVQVSVPSGDGGGSNSGGSDKGDGIGGSRPDANAGDGLGGGAGMVAMDERLTVLAVIFALGLVAM
ncbi:hypothetical protein VC83_01699 [Pseudogymnoascus destructans]|uniref:Uncharacterized protein n=2 Tax=Pseudogymnoascus destructans TaxID=655981 RepID=L8FUF8_PSED2|nr:uncharacterized protein VC83_01699 [Pseudogymnoascus destructans]ELR03386.1 hypothetical protein GMDG_06127 [Pseudogymnoascus destructans 20631-21]OAF62149.1 hypothetical protein VC83_01699 [Pseudogymnoascus destructans]